MADAVEESLQSERVPRGRLESAQASIHSNAGESSIASGISTCIHDSLEGESPPLTHHSNRTAPVWLQSVVAPSLEDSDDEEVDLPGLADGEDGQGSAEDLRQSIDQALRLHHGYRQYLDTTAQEGPVSTSLDSAGIAALFTAGVAAAGHGQSPTAMPGVLPTQSAGQLQTDEFEEVGAEAMMDNQVLEEFHEDAHYSSHVDALPLSDYEYDNLPGMLLPTSRHIDESELERAIQYFRDNPREAEMNEDEVPVTYVGRTPAELMEYVDQNIAANTNSAVRERLQLQRSQGIQEFEVTPGGLELVPRDSSFQHSGEQHPSTQMASPMASSPPRLFTNTGLPLENDIARREDVVLSRPSDAEASRLARELWNLNSDEDEDEELEDLLDRYERGEVDNRDVDQIDRFEDTATDYNELGLYGGYHPSFHPSSLPVTNSHFGFQLSSDEDEDNARAPVHSWRSLVRGRNHSSAEEEVCLTVAEIERQEVSDDVNTLRGTVMAKPHDIELTESDLSHHEDEDDEDRDIDESSEPVSLMTDYKQLLKKWLDSTEDQSDPAFQYRLMLNEPPIPHQYAYALETADRQSLDPRYSAVSPSGIVLHRRIGDKHWPAMKARENIQVPIKGDEPTGQRHFVQLVDPASRQLLLNDVSEAWLRRAKGVGQMRHAFPLPISMTTTFEERPVCSVACGLPAPAESTTPLALATITLCDPAGSHNSRGVDEEEFPSSSSREEYSPFQPSTGGTSAHAVHVMGDIHLVLLAWLLSLAASPPAPASDERYRTGTLESPPFQVKALQQEVTSDGTLQLSVLLLTEPWAVYDQVVFFMMRHTVVELADCLQLAFQPNSNFVDCTLSDVIALTLCADGAQRFNSPSSQPGLLASPGYAPCLDDDGVADILMQSAAPETVVVTMPQALLADPCAVVAILEAIDSHPAVVVGLRLLYGEDSGFAADKMESVCAAIAVFGPAARKLEIGPRGEHPPQAQRVGNSSPEKSIDLQHSKCLPVPTVTHTEKRLVRDFGPRLLHSDSDKSEFLDPVKHKCQQLLVVPMQRHYLLVASGARSEGVVDIVSMCSSQGMLLVSMRHTLLSETWLNEFGLSKGETQLPCIITHLVSYLGTHALHRAAEKLNMLSVGLSEARVCDFAPKHISLQACHLQSEQSWASLRNFHVSPELEQLSTVVVFQQAMHLLPDIVKGLIMPQKSPASFPPCGNANRDELELVGIRLAHMDTSSTLPLVDRRAASKLKPATGLTCVLCVRGLEAIRRVKTWVNSLQQRVLGVAFPRSALHAVKLASLWFRNGHALFKEEARRKDRHLHPPDGEFDGDRSSSISSPGDMLYQWLGERRITLTTIVAPPCVSIQMYPALLRLMATNGFLLVGCRLRKLSASDVQMLRETSLLSDEGNKALCADDISNAASLVLCWARENSVGRLVSMALEAHSAAVRSSHSLPPSLIVPKSFDCAACVLSTFFQNGVTLLQATMDMEEVKIPAPAIDTELSLERSHDTEAIAKLLSPWCSPQDIGSDWAVPNTERIPLILAPPLLWTDEKKDLLLTNPLTLPFTAILSRLLSREYTVVAMKMLRLTKEQVTFLQLTCKLFPFASSSHLTCGPSLVMVLEGSRSMRHLGAYLSGTELSSISPEAVDYNKLVDFPTDEEKARRLMAYLFSEIPGQ